MEEKWVFYKFGSGKDKVQISRGEDVADIREKIKHRLGLTIPSINLVLDIEGRSLDPEEKIESLDLENKCINVTAPPQIPSQQQVTIQSQLSRPLPSKTKEEQFDNPPLYSVVDGLTFLGPLSVGARHVTWELQIKRKPKLIGKTADIFNEEKLTQELIHESEIYSLLRPLQGQVIPKVHYSKIFYCVYIFATEKCGKSLDKLELSSLNIDQIERQAKIGLDRIHSFMVLHGDIRLNNLVWNEKTSQLFWIDFGFSKQNAKRKELLNEKRELQHLFTDLKENA